MKRADLSYEVLNNVANSVASYLKTRLMFTQRLRSTYAKKTLIDLDNFIEKYSKIDNDIQEIEDNNNPVLVQMYDELCNLERIYSDKIIISESQINELTELVRASVLKCGIFDDVTSFDGNGFISQFLRDYKKSADTADESRLDYWVDAVNYLSLSEVYLISPLLNGVISFGYSCLISAENHNHKDVFSYDLNGQLSGYRPLESEHFLIAEDLFVGRYNNGGDSPVQDIFLKKTISDGFECVYGIVCCKLLPIQEIIYIEDFNSYCEKMSVGEMCKYFYSETTEILDIYHVIINADKEDIRQFEKISNVAARWWVNAVLSPRFDNGSDSGVGLTASVVAGICSSLILEMVDSSSLDIFGKILKKRIKSKLLSQGKCYLSVDYDPCVELDESSKEAGIGGIPFPWKTSMQISLTDIKVKSGHMMDYVVIYAE